MRTLVVGLCALVCVAGTVLPDVSLAAETRLLRRRVATEDGVLLALYRYAPRKGMPREPPVLLVPDLGMGREAYDLDGEGLAPFLAARGRDVFVLEPRGHGLSAAPEGWRLAQLVQFDLPAAVAAIREEREGPVDLVVHGWTGTLVLGACSEELKGRVRRVVALSTPVDPLPPSVHAARFLEGGGRLAAFARDPSQAEAFEVLFARHGRVPKRTLARLRDGAFHDLSPAAAADLRAWMTEGELTVGTRSMTDRLRAYDRPTLQLVALRNNWAGPEAATPLRELAPEAKVQLRVLSILHYLSEDYTHLSLLHGAKAADEIFLPVARFLALGESGEETP